MKTSIHFHHISLISSWNEKYFKRYRENQNTFCLQQFFFFENRAVYKKMWKNNVERGKPQMTIWRIRIACWLPEATNIHSQYVLLIPFPL